MNEGKTYVSEQHDMLREIFRMQDLLNKRIGNDFTSDPIIETDVNSDTAQSCKESRAINWLLQYTRALQQETAELIDSVPWKWWAKYQKFDLQNARVEVVDMLHFLVSIAQVLGMDADMMYNLYHKKNIKNFARQDDGYTCKDPDDCRGLTADSKGVAK